MWVLWIGQKDLHGGGGPGVVLISTTQRDNPGDHDPSAQCEDVETAEGWPSLSQAWGSDQSWVLQTLRDIFAPSWHPDGGADLPGPRPVAKLDVYDKVDYLSSWEKTQTAAVQRDADIGVAEAERDAGIREAECKREMMDMKFKADTLMAAPSESWSCRRLLQPGSKTQEAEAQLAYELQGAKEAAEDPAGGDRDRGGAEEEADHHRGEGGLRMEKELIANVKRPARPRPTRSSSWPKDRR
ncbi:unnamed protein product [Arctogadus glacialis]